MQIKSKNSRAALLKSATKSWAAAGEQLFTSLQTAHVFWIQLIGKASADQLGNRGNE